MAEYCGNCGTELFSGQRFCRACGNPTNAAAEEQTPTRLMPPESGGYRPAANTAPPSSPDTSPVYVPPPAYYQSQYPQAQQPYTPQTYAPPRSRSPWGWIIALVAIAIFGFGFLGALMFSRMLARRIPSPPGPPPPPMAAKSGEKVIGDQDAQSIQVSDKETSVTQPFKLSKDATISINNLSGNVTVEGWDQPQAEVRVIKRGGSVQERQNLRVMYSSDVRNLSLRTAPSSGSRVEVEYVIKAPRNLSQIKINSASSTVKLSGISAKVSVDTQSGSIKISDIEGDVSIDTQSGSIELTEVTGEITASTKSGSIELKDVIGGANTNSVSGDTKVVFEKVAPDAALEFKSVSGDVELQFKSDINAELDAKTLTGDIEISDELGLKVEKQRIGRQVSGTVGTGGQSLSIETVSGNIKVTK